MADRPNRRGLMIILEDDALTREQGAHVEELAQMFFNEMSAKYIAGQKEHGGNLWDQTEDQLLDNAIQEAIDQVVYLMTIRRKRRAAASNASNSL